MATPKTGIVSDGPEAQDSLFERTKPHHETVPSNLVRAHLRLQFPPTYVLVGAYRLFTDKLLYIPAWDKCRHATRRGAIVGAAWAVCTFHIQRKFIEIFLANSPRIIGLSNDTIFGYKVPFNIHTYTTDAAVVLVGQQITTILRFFLSRNIRIARDRVWAQTVASRGKGDDFWGPYVEEWDVPPPVPKQNKWEKFFGGRFGGRVGFFVVKKVLLVPFDFYPFVGILIAAGFKSLATARFLHRRYFEAKKMNDNQIAVYMEERKWDYWLFGFTAALLEGLPIIGLVFTVSNRVGAAMWAHDLEKRQHFVAETRARGVESTKEK